MPRSFRALRARVEEGWLRHSSRKLLLNDSTKAFLAPAWAIPRRAPLGRLEGAVDRSRTSQEKDAGR